MMFMARCVLALGLVILGLSWGAAMLLLKEAAESSLANYSVVSEMIPVLFLTGLLAIAVVVSSISRRLP